MENGGAPTRGGIAWNSVLLFALALFGLAFMAFDKERGASLARSSVLVEWRGDSLSLTSGGGTLVVTHLLSTEHSLKGAPCATAALPRPIALVEEAGGTAQVGPLSELNWRDEAGNIVPPPEPGSPIQAVYYQARVSPAPQSADQPAVQIEPPVQPEPLVPIPLPIPAPSSGST